MQFAQLREGTVRRAIAYVLPGIDTGGAQTKNRIGRNVPCAARRLPVHAAADDEGMNCRVLIQRQRKGQGKLCRTGVRIVPIDRARRKKQCRCGRPTVTQALRGYRGVQLREFISRRWALQA